jgi:fructose-1,6-bisphosphatase/inositol monophosphatase family enzyme
MLEGRLTNRSIEVAKKAMKRVRREYTREDVKELRAHSKARTPVTKIAKLTKRTIASLRRKAQKLGIGLGHQR